MFCRALEKLSHAIRGVHDRQALLPLYFRLRVYGREASGSTLVSSLPLASPPSSSPSTVRAFLLKFLSDPVDSLCTFFH